MEKINIKTSKRVELVDITSQLQDAVRESKVRDGVCLVFCPHTTAGLTINENADPSVRYDIINALNKFVPKDAGYTHTEGNADSHIKSSIFGAVLNIFVEDNQLCLGQWQGVYLCEGDGPRSREVWIKFLKG